MKLCIYHANCLDGFGAAFCHWLAHRKEEEEWHYVPAEYNVINTVNELLAIFPELCSPEEHEVAVLDFSLSGEVTYYLIIAKNIKFFMLDHHKTAFEMMRNEGYDCRYPLSYKMSGPTAYVQLDNDRSGALQSADFFRERLSAHVYSLMQAIDDRDRWQFRLPTTREICAALANWEQNFYVWQDRIRDPNYDIFSEGSSLVEYKDKLVKQFAAEYTTRELWGCKVKLCNCPPQFASDVGNILAKNEEYIAACYFITEDGRAKVSLRSVGDTDVSAIAKQFDGGGHKNAAGFKLPLRAIDRFLNEYPPYFGDGSHE